MFKLITLSFERCCVVADEVEFVPDKVEQIRQPGSSGRTSTSRSTARAWRGSTSA